MLATYDLALDLDDVAVPGDVVPGARNRGRAEVEVYVVTAGGGSLTWVAGRDSGRAVRTPRYSPDGEVAAAALVIWPESSEHDPLSPGLHDFTIGADFLMDPSAPGRAEDDGDNLVQRGRYDAGSQIKLQVDDGVPSCRVAGNAGEVVLTAGEAVTAGHWYRLSCGRTQGEIWMALLDLEESAPATSTRSTADPGAVRLAGTPLSVGAKVNAEGLIDPESTDQFNGQIDRVYVDVQR